MKSLLKGAALAVLLAGACLPATIVCDVPDVDVFVRRDADWEDFFEDIFDGHHHHHDDFFEFEWFDWW